MKQWIIIGGILFFSNHFISAQLGINEINIVYTDSIHGYSEYRIVGIGKDTSLRIFERPKIVLTKLKYIDHPSFRFQYDGSFTFSYGARKMIGEQRAYYEDDNGDLVHTNDKIEYMAFNSFTGEYSIDKDGRLIIEVKYFLQAGLGWPNTVDDNPVMFKYNPTFKNGEIILTKEK